MDTKAEREPRDDESDLLEASRRGDAVAFGGLVSRYQRMIHALTYRMTGSEADASDLAQEAFLQAWRRLDDFRGEARFSSWLYRIAVNLTLNWRAREARETAVRLEWAGTEEGGGWGRSGAWDGGGGAGGEAGAGLDGLAARRAAWVREALLRLPAKQRAAVVLTVYDGLKHAEAAEALGCSEATVSWRVFAAKTRLKRGLKAFEAQERNRS